MNIFLTVVVSVIYSGFVERQMSILDVGSKVD
jgi:hypothetical protein